MAMVSMVIDGKHNKTDVRITVCTLPPHHSRTGVFSCCLQVLTNLILLCKMRFLLLNPVEGLQFCCHLSLSWLLLLRHTKTTIFNTELLGLQEHCAEDVVSS